MKPESDPRDQFLSSIDQTALRVDLTSAPIVLLCGGQSPHATQKSADTIDAVSVRQAITQTGTPFEVFLPEEIKHWQEDGIYQNLMEFEKDLAGVCSLVVVVLESPGAIAELGAFSQLPEMSDRLFVLRSNAYGEDQSFINLGILRYLRDQNSESVKSYPWEVIHGKISINPTVLAHIVGDIGSELSQLAKTKNFSKDDVAHQLTLICDLTSTFRALKSQEILKYLRFFGIEMNGSRLKRSLFLLEAFRLLKKFEYSSNTYYLRGETEHHRVIYRLKDKKNYDRLRIILSCNEFYEKTDSHRKLAIAHVLGGADE